MSSFRLFYDLETSGRGCACFSQERVVELAAIAVDSSATADSIAGLTRRAVGSPDILPPGCFSELISNGPSEYRAFAVHGISAEMSSRARPFAAVWSSFMTFCVDAFLEFKETNSGCKRVSFIGFNSFGSDNYQLLAELRRAGLSFREEFPTVIFEDVYPRTNEKKLALRTALKTTNLKNTSIYQHTTGKRVDPSSVHHALWDAAATRESWVSSAVVRAQTSRLSLEKQNALLDLLIGRQRAEMLPDPPADLEDAE
jgi:hypothetical protein